MSRPSARGGDGRSSRAQRPPNGRPGGVRRSRSGFGRSGFGRGVAGAATTGSAADRRRRERGSVPERAPAHGTAVPGRLPSHGRAASARDPGPATASGARSDASAGRAAGASGRRALQRRPAPAPRRAACRSEWCCTPLSSAGAGASPARTIAAAASKLGRRAREGGISYLSSEFAHTHLPGVTAVVASDDRRPLIAPLRDTAALISARAISRVVDQERRRIVDPRGCALALSGVRPRLRWVCASATDDPRPAHCSRRGAVIDHSTRGETEQRSPPREARIAERPGPGSEPLL